MVDVLVRVDVWLEASGGRRLCLAHDEAKTFRFEGACPQDILLLMGARPRAYFRARINERRELALIEDAGWLGW